MSDNPTISYSYQMGDQPPAKPESGAHVTTSSETTGASLYAVDEYETLNVAGGVLLVGKTTGGQMLMAQEVAMVLQHCTMFRSLDHHARHLVTVFPQLGGNTEDALRVLELVRDAGLFIPAEKLCAGVNKPVCDSSPVDRSKVFVITCDRPQAVQRLLESMLKNGRLARHKQLYLIDDSRDLSHAVLNREAVEQFNLVSPTNMRYVGVEEQKQLVNAIVAGMPEQREAIGFLLDREQWGTLKTYGRARTLCLLLSVGDRCVVMDDDVLCVALHSQESGRAPAFSNGMSEAEFYTDIEHWQPKWQQLEFDPLSGHSRCLGLRLGDALRELGLPELQPVHLQDVRAAPFLAVDSDTPVLVTQAGTIGDPGTANNAWLSNMTVNSIQRMVAAPGGLMNALATRQCWLGHPGPIISKRAVMSQVTGLDNRHTLPPYFPALRGEDQLFGAMLDFLIPDSAVLEYDWAVPHLPLEDRHGNRAGDSVVPRGGLQLLAAYLSEANPDDPNVSESTRLELLAARLQTLAGHSTQELVARFRSGLTRSQALVLQTLNDRVRDTGELGAPWKQYLESSAQQCVAALQQPASLSELPGVPQAWSEDRLADEIRRCADSFAAALLAWPKMRDVARNLEL